MGHVRHALGVQVLGQGFHGATEGVERILSAVLVQYPQHASNIGCASHIHGSLGQFIHGGEIARQPVSVGKIEPIVPRVEKGLTRFCSKAERHIIALRITPAHRQSHRQ